MLMGLFLQLLKNIALPPSGPPVSDKAHSYRCDADRVSPAGKASPSAPLAAVKSFSLSSAFSGLVLTSVGMDFLEFVLFGVHSSLIVCSDCLDKFGVFSVITVVVRILTCPLVHTPLPVIQMLGRCCGEAVWRES